MNVKMKEQLLELLQDMMLGSHGEKLKPKAMSIEVIEPVKGKNLEDVLDKAQADAPADLDGDGDHDMDDHEMEDCEDDKKESLQDFFKKMRG